MFSNVMLFICIYMTTQQGHCMGVVELKVEQLEHLQDVAPCCKSYGCIYFFVVTVNSRVKHHRIRYKDKNKSNLR